MKGMLVENRKFRQGKLKLNQFKNQAIYVNLSQSVIQLNELSKRVT